MKGNTATKGPRTDSAQTNPFKLRKKEDASRELNPLIHLHHGFRCDTENRGYKTPNNLSPAKLVLNAPGGHIALWDKDTTLRWRFQERSISRFEDQKGLQDATMELMSEALLAWGDAVPVKFTQDDNVWDFEIKIMNDDDCDGGGCVLASSFFPGNNQEELDIYPMMFTQSRHEQIDTLIHEDGHIFGLRHFFAQISETAWPSEKFGVHNKFTIMNYGADSELTEDDKNDLKHLYEMAWSGELTEINGTPIKFVKPFSAK